MIQGGLAALGTANTRALLFYGSNVFLLVAIYTQQLPVTAVGRIVVMIVVKVMHRKFAQFFAFELTAAAPAYMGKQLQRSFSITTLAFRRSAPRLGNDCRRFFLLIHSLNSP